MNNEINSTSYLILDELIEGCQIIDFEWKYIYINKSAASQNKRPAKELLGKTYMEMWPGIEETEVFSTIKECFKDRKRKQFLNRFVFPDGNVGWYELSIQPVPEGVFILSIDKTEQKILEQELRESEERWKFAIEGAGDGIWEWKVQTNEVFFSKIWKEMLGYKADEFENDFSAWEKGVHPDDIEEVYECLRKHLEGESPVYINEHRMKCKDGTYKWLLDRGKVSEWTEDGKPLRMLGSHTDIDKRKKAELELQRQKERFESFSATVPGMLCTFRRSPEGEYTMPFASSASQNIYGFTSEQLFKNFGIVFERIHPDDINEIISSIEDSARLMKPWKQKFRYNHPVKGEIWIDGHSMPVTENDGSIMWHGYINDITEEVEAETAIRESEQKFQTLFNNSPVGLHFFNFNDGNVVACNKVLLEIVGYKIDEVIGKKVSDMKLAVNPQEFSILVEQLKTSGKVENFELDIRKKSGEIRTILTSMEIIEIDEQPMVMVATTDISRQKQIEKEIIKNEKLLRLFVEYAPASIAMFDKQLNYIIASQRYSADFGLEHHNLPGKPLYSVVPNITEKWIEIHNRGIAGEILGGKEDIFHHKNGQIDYFNWEIRPWYLEENEIGGIILFSEVVTEQILAKNKLKESEAYNRMLFDLSITGLALVKMNGTFIDVNEAFAEMVGYTISEVLQLTYWQLTPEKYAESEQEQLKLLNETGKYGPYEKKYIHKNGHLVPVRLRGIIIERNGEKLIWSSVEDISDQKAAEEKLSYNQMLINQMGKVAKIGGWEFDPATGKGTWTEEVARIHDLDPNNETNLELGISFYTAESRTKIDKAINEAIANGTPYDLELEMKTQKGNHKWVHTIGQAIYKEGKIINIRGSFQDITVRKLSEKQLRDSEEKFRTVFEQSASGMVLAGIDGKLIDYNHVFSEMLEYQKDELKNVHYNSFTHPEDYAIGNNIVKQLLEGKLKKVAIQKRYLKKSGDFIWARINTVLLRDMNNKPEFFISQIEDISDEVEAENRLKASESRYRALVEQTLTGIYIFDIRRYKYVNRRFCDIFGYSEEEIYQMNPNDIIAEEDRDRVNLNAQKRLHGEIEGATFVVKGKHKSGNPLWIELYGRHIVLNDNDVIIGTIVDITEEKLSQDKIKTLNEQLEQKVVERTVQLEMKNKELETFTYSVSHDLKAPLRGIDGYSKLMEELYDDKLDGEASYFLKSIREGTKQMNQLIEDLLSYSRLERAMIRYTRFNLKDLVQRMLSLYQNQIESKKVKINVNFSDTEIYTDIDSISVALRNVLENAIKFSSENNSPEIEIKCEKNTDIYIVSVKDNGIGFDLKYKDRIFEIFQRLNLVEDFPGTGIGLAMVKKSMERIGGNVRTESQPGKGATFYLEIPKINQNENN